MNIRELIDLAVQKSGQPQNEMAIELKVKPARLSEWKSEERKPDAGEIAYFAEKAGLDVAETVMEVERNLDPRFKEIWERALGNLRAATLAATSSKMTKDQTTRTLIAAVVNSLGNKPDQVQIKAGLMAVLNAFPEEQPTIATAPTLKGANARGVAAKQPRLRKSLRT
jgi:hypothetical protein